MRGADVGGWSTGSSAPSLGLGAPPTRREILRSRHPIEGPDVHELSLIQALVAARDLARQHDGDPWRALETRLDGLLGTLHTRDPDDSVGADEPRLDREALDDRRADEVYAALLAVGEAPDEDRAEVALERLDLLDGGAGRGDRPEPPEPDPAIADEGW